MALTRNQKKNIVPFPFYIYFGTVGILILGGLAASVYLAIAHYRIYTDITYSSFCAISKAINCDTVSLSSYSIFLGVPVSVWGVTGYVFVFILFLFAWNKDAHKKRPWSVIFVIFCAYSIYSLALAYVSILRIHSYCLMCIAVYGINFSLTLFAFLIRRRFDDVNIIKGLSLDIIYLKNKKQWVVPISVFFTSLVIGLHFYFPSYWHINEPALGNNVPRGITKEGYPWIGTADPIIEIMEFTDYQCFQCKKMHYYIRRLVTENPGKIKLIHRHFPMDHEYNPLVKKPFHIGSGLLALYAEYAHSQGKFWEMNDLLFSSIGKSYIVDIKLLAEKCGLNSILLSNAINDKYIRYRVKHDINIGIKKGITGTPGFIVNDKVYRGNIPPEILSGILDK